MPTGSSCSPARNRHCSPPASACSSLATRCWCRSRCTSPTRRRSPPPGPRLVRVPLVAERGFHLDLDALAAAVTPRTRAILINSPHNPTGAVMTRHELESRGRSSAGSHDLWLISDEVYATMLYEGEHVAPAGLPGMEERTVTVVEPVQVACHDRLARRLADRAAGSWPGMRAIWRCACSTARHLHPGCGDHGAARRRRRDRRACASSSAGAAMPSAAGSPVCPASAARGPRVACSSCSTCVAPASPPTNSPRRLLDEEGVCVLAGDAFGGAAAGHVRLSLTAPDERLAEACNRIGRFAFRLAAAAGVAPAGRVPDDRTLPPAGGVYAPRAIQEDKPCNGSREACDWRCWSSRASRSISARSRR